MCSLMIESTRNQIGSPEPGLPLRTLWVKAMLNLTCGEDSLCRIIFSTSMRKCAICSVCFVHAFLSASYTWQEALPIVWYFRMSLRTVRDELDTARFATGIARRVCKDSVLRSPLCERSLVMFSSSLDFEKLRRSFSPTLRFQSLFLILLGVVLESPFSQRLE